MPRFFESIRFETNETALAITDGPGELLAEDPANLIPNGETRILTGKEVTKKAIAVQKPEPSYTDDARLYQVTGTVVLRAVLSSSGAVTNIRLVSGLPHGLSEKAIEAARQIRFIPAIHDGHFVSMHIQFEYSFNLY
jgi:TonB family protein